MATRIYVSGRKAPVIVTAPFESVQSEITDAIRNGVPFVEYESGGSRFTGSVSIRVERIVGLREHEIVPDYTVDEDYNADAGSNAGADDAEQEAAINAA